MVRVVEEQIKKSRAILAKSIPLSKYLKENKLGYADGATGVLCCPVHDESTPSFRYDDIKGECHCFGCGIGGTIVELNYRVKQKENDRYTMIRSIKDLARDYNVEIPNLYERSLEIKKGRSPSKRKRGTSGRDVDWIYREKLLMVEGRVKGMSDVERIKIAGLMDDVWLGKIKAQRVYKEILKMSKNTRGNTRE